MPLASLPTELTELIVIHLDLDDFRALRLTCRTVSNQTIHSFKERFFHTRKLDWTQKSFDQLLAISDHAHLWDALLNLHIDATPRHSIHLWQVRKRISEAQAIVGPYQSTYNICKSNLERQYAEDNKEAEVLATFFNETRYDQKCLRTVFDRLVKDGKSLRTIVFEYEGMDKKFGKFGRRYCESSQNEMSRPFVSTLAAIAASRIQVKEILIHHINNHGAIGVGRLESLAPMLNGFNFALENLTVLQLNLRDWRYPEVGFLLEGHRKAPFVVRFLTKARNLKSLDLSIYSSLEVDLFGEMAQHCRFERLESCKLSLLRIFGSDDLENFLSSSSQSLKSLHLSHAILTVADTTWPDFLRDFALSKSLPVLERLELINLFAKGGARIMFDEFGLTTRLVVGALGCKERWRDMLINRVDDFTESGSGPAWHMGAVAYPYDMQSSRIFVVP